MSLDKEDYKVVIYMFNQVRQRENFQVVMY